jgi:DNA-binding response OmpR family regulator
VGKLILVVAEDEEVLDFVQAALEREGYQVQASPTGLCFQQGASHPPDLILLDVLVTPAVGRTVTQQWQERASTNAIPLVFFSAQIRTSQVLQGSSLALFPARPCHIRPLLDAVWKSLSSSFPSFPGATLPSPREGQVSSEAGMRWRGVLT